MKFKISGFVTHTYEVQFEVEADSIQEVQNMPRWRLEDHALSAIDRHDEPTGTDFEVDDIEAEDES